MAGISKPKLDEDSIAPPPKDPASRAELERAIVLLGSRQTQDLRTSARDELIGLLGEYPSPEVAAIWKRWLKAVRTDFQPDAPE